MTSTHSFITVLGARDVRIRRITIPNMVTPSDAIEISVVDENGITNSVSIHVAGLPSAVVARLLGEKS